MCLQNLDFSMLIILLDEKFGLKNVIKKLDVKTIEYITDGKNYKGECVLLRMPKFKIEYEANLNETLRSLEIKDAFDKEIAEFSEISMQSRELYVSEVVHKTLISTNEEGTEAAAATGIYWEYLCGFPKPIQFTVDHPFLFMILYKNQTLFMGKVTSL